MIGARRMQILSHARNIGLRGVTSMCQRCRVVKAATLSTEPRREPHEQT